MNLELIAKIKAIPANLWFYDFEVFERYWCVSFYHLKANKWYFFDNAHDLKAFYHHTLTGFLIGFNSVRYDDYLLKAVLMNLSPFAVSNFIIHQKEVGWKYPGLKDYELKCYSVDVMDMLGGTRLSLKTYEAFLGLAITESSVPFNYNQDLTPQQKAEIKAYNVADVKACAHLFCKFIDQLLIKLKLIEDYQLPFNSVKKTLAGLTALLFQADKCRLRRYERYQLQIHAKIKAIYAKYLPEFNWVIKKFEGVEYKTIFDPEYIKDQINFKIPAPDYEIDCGSGGAHGAKNNYLSATDELIIVADYFSNYPNLIANFQLGSRAVLNMETTIKKMLNEREIAKANHNTLKSAYLKNALVIPFGSMDYVYNPLWDPQQRQGICVSGQLMIVPVQILLKKKFGDSITFLQINTDGIIFKLNNPAILKAVQTFFGEWEKVTNLKMELSYFKKMYQKDVNNYILIDDVNDQKNWKVKGKFVKYYKKQFHKKNYHEVRGSPNNVLTVIDMAVVNYFTQNVPVIETIKNCTDLIAFQFVFQIRGKYEGIMLGETILANLKTCRLFFTKTGQPVFKIYHTETNELKKEKIALTSERCQILNGDIRKMTVNELNLDYDYYAKIATEHINLYQSVKPTNQIISQYGGECFECQLCSGDLSKEKVVRYFFDKEICKACYLKKQK